MTVENNEYNENIVSDAVTEVLAVRAGGYSSVGYVPALYDLSMAVSGEVDRQRVIDYAYQVSNARTEKEVEELVKKFSAPL